MHKITSIENTYLETKQRRHKKRNVRRRKIVTSLTRCGRRCQSHARRSVPSVAGNAARSSTQPNFVSNLRRIIIIKVVPRRPGWERPQKVDVCVPCHRKSPGQGQGHAQKAGTGSSQGQRHYGWIKYRPKAAQFSSASSKDGGRDVLVAQLGVPEPRDIRPYIRACHSAIV